MKVINEIVTRAKDQETTTLVVANAADIHVLEAVEQARKDDIVSPVLIGEKELILNLLSSLGIDAKKYKVIHADNDIDSCKQAVKIVSSNPNHVLMKGKVSTSIILREALNKEYGLRTGNRLSHVTVIENNNYHKLLVMSDGAMNIAPNKDQKIEIINNTKQLFNVLQIDKPKVAVISAVEKYNEKMLSTVDAVNIKEHFKTCNEFLVDGPFALDNAINKEAAVHKGIDSLVAGDADLLVMPQIESGNVFYKAMMFLTTSKSASVILGAKKPIIITSRADSKETKYHSIALASIISKEV